MPDTSTEVAIATTTLGSASSTIDFTSIPGTYTDLRLVFVGYGSGTGTPLLRLRFNSDTGTNYSVTLLYGDGSAAYSTSAVSANGIFLVGNGALGLSKTTPVLATADIFSYAGSTNKTVLSTESQDLNGSGEAVYNVSLWRSTSAITSINLSAAGTASFVAGTTATLYGFLGGQMPSSRILIASNTLGSSAASVTFSSIPSTYTDLVLKFSARATGGITRYILARINSDSSALYSSTYLYTTTAPGVASGRESAVTYAYTLAYLSGSSSTASTFGNGELYLPSYTASQNKPFSAFGVGENNSANDANIGVSANLYRSTSAITEIILSLNSDSFASGSTFWLYGIKNS